MPEPVYKRSGSKFWQIRYTDAYKREVRLSSGTEDYGEAQALYTKLKEGAGLSLTDIAEDFFEKKKMSDKTYQCYRTSFRAWVEVIANPRLEFIDIDTIREFVSARLGEVKEGTIRNDLAFMSSLFKYAMMMEHGPKSNPVKAFDKSGLAVSEPRVRYLRPDQVRKLMGLIKEPHRQLIFLFGIEAGLRKGEILSLKAYQINLWSRYILLEGQDTKTKKGRRVPMSRTLIRAVAAHLRANPHLRNNPGSSLIVNPDTRLPYTEVRPWWNNALRDAKIEDFTFHDTRHHFASTYVQRGGRLQPLSRMLGHTTTAMSEKYAHLSDQDAANEFHSIMKGKV